MAERGIRPYQESKVVDRNSKHRGRRQRTYILAALSGRSYGIPRIYARGFVGAGSLRRVCDCLVFPPECAAQSTQSSCKTRCPDLRTVRLRPDRQRLRAMPGMWHGDPGGESGDVVERERPLARPAPRRRSACHEPNPSCTRMDTQLRHRMSMMSAAASEWVARAEAIPPPPPIGEQRCLKV